MATYLASCSNIVLTHDISNPKSTSRMTPHTGKVNCVTYNHNSRVLASSGDDGNIVLSHTETSDQLAVLEPTSFPASPLNSIAFTSKSDMIGCGSLDGAVRVWDLRKKEVTASFKHHTDSVSCVTWNYTDQQIVSSSISGEIMVHSLLTKVSVGNLKLKGSAGIKVVQFSPFKKNFLGAGSENGSVYIWDINLRSVACSFPSFHNSPVTGLAFSAINHMLMCTSGLDQRINFYDTHEKKIVKTIDVESPLTCISYANDGHTLAGGTLYGTILIYDLRSPGTPKNVLKGHEGNAINWLDFSKSRDIKSRIQRDTSKDTRDNTRDARENKDLKENTRNTFFIPEDVVVGFSRFRPAEEVSVGASRFRTVEEIKQEAKMRVEQKRRERANEESKIDVKPDLSNIVRTSAQDRSPILNREEKVNLSTLDVRTEKPIPSLRPASREKTYEKLDEVKLEKQEKIPEKIERKERKEEFEDAYPQNDDQSRNQEPYNDRKYQPEENLDLRSNRELMEMFESRLNIQDEVIFDLKEDVQNLHVEMIRQFMIQINEIKSLLSDYSVANSNLLSENKYLKEEIDRLKKTSY